VCHINRIQVKREQQRLDKQKKEEEAILSDAIQSRKIQVAKFHRTYKTALAVSHKGRLPRFSKLVEYESTSSTRISVTSNSSRLPGIKELFGQLLEKAEQNEQNDMRFL
jgi:hypothetical protein